MHEEKKESIFNDKKAFNFFFFRVTAFSIFFYFSFAWFAGSHCVLPL